ncbi:hypothetical protein HDU67_001728 [Dinochytrium kinnereticum]|nr:hypothetical protein HDU67_001728 [Dinochytrium kinnereticum]
MTDLSPHPPPQTSTTSVAYFQISTGSVAIYCCLELYVMIFMRFKRYDNLYFWSIMVATTGTLLFTVTGFSVIMYSRLSVVSVPKHVIRYVLYMIIFNFVFSHLPTTFLTFMANITKAPTWKRAYAIEEKIQMTLFWIQESILSSIYLFYTRRLSGSVKKAKNKTIIAHTVYLNIFVLFLDLVALVFEYLDLYDYQIMFKAFLYGIKIKSEFAILNILMDVLLPMQVATTAVGNDGVPISIPAAPGVDVVGLYDPNGGASVVTVDVEGERRMKESEVW